MALWHNVMIVVWSTRATLSMVAELDKLIQSALAVATNGKVSAINVAMNGSPLPEPDVRLAFDEITRRYGSHIVASYLVVGAGGFWASALRSFVTGLQLVRDRKLRVHVATSLDEVAGLLPAVHLETGVRIEEAALRRVLQALTARARAA